MQVIRQESVGDTIVTEYAVDLVLDMEGEKFMPYAADTDGTSVRITRMIVAKHHDEDPDEPEEEMHGICATVYVAHDSTPYVHGNMSFVYGLRKLIGMRDFTSTNWKDFDTVVQGLQ